MEQFFLEIVEEYERFKNIDFISGNIFNIKDQIISWKKKLEDFKKLKISEDKKHKIQEIEQDIIKKNEIIKNLSFEYDPEWQKLNIKPLTIEEFERNFTDIIIFGNKESASNSLILRGIYDCMPVFIKAFSSTEVNLIRELSIYKYISSIEKHINPTVKSYMDDYFIRLKKKFSINKKTFFEFLERTNIQQIKNQGEPNEERKIYFSTKVDSVFNKIPEIFVGDNMCFIVTEDIEGKSVERMCHFLSQIEENRHYKLRFPNHEDYKDLDIYPAINPKKELINIIFELIYGLYLLNKYFRIQHNDLHFNNVIIKKINPINKNFIIGNTSIKKKSNIRVAIYDYDKSSIMSQSISEHSNDVYKIRQWFTLNMFTGTTLREISRNIELMDNFDIEVMLLKFIHHYSNELDIEEANPFFKKYLKYKNKYLNYKNKYNYL